ncbi:TonB-dependent hemoglobin/transferrin/lactoferrin family receptor [Picosynechococcus sp. PCC 7003]|uniref:TonB-dependent hemoglobin/transferrin/lactoferrin family receptor n=1 Tax=Picosynechococcus sp. PCC 7003 TaxID=374981 RepID=UPI000A72741C|nr:TonB-dependent hemoglobin/transferrin/lactoferrin family receptor [Picosynechococcus sp. PCC 7003]
MKPYQLRYGLALCGLVPFMFCVSPGEAIAQINPETNFLAQAQPVTITGIRLDPQPDRVNIILETAAGQSLTLPGQPFIQRGTDLVATVEPAILALPDGQNWQFTAPTADIAAITVEQQGGDRLEIIVQGQGELPATAVSLDTMAAIATNEDMVDLAEMTLNLDAMPVEELEITVLGTRSPRLVNRTPGSISVIDAEEIDDNLVQDLRDLVRYEPNVSVGNDRRYGLQDINIRGLGGNRVLILNDGIRIPTQFTFGTPALGRDYVDLDSLQRVEIIRGPASALYGSDALGGVVSFQTIDPSDLLALTDKNNFTRISTGFETTDKSLNYGAVTAFRAGSLEALIGYNGRSGFEARLPEGNEFVDDRYGDRDNFLGKLNFNLSENSTLAFTTEIFRSTNEFQVAPITAPLLQGPRGFQGQNETLEADSYRERYSLAYLYDNPDGGGFIDNAKAQIYYQNAGVDELRTQDFLNSAETERRFRNLSNTFTDELFGGEVQLQSNFRWGNIDNRLTYGFDLSKTNNERTRDGLETRFDAAGNVTLTTNQVGSDNFPVKDFPDSETTRFGIYLQNEMALSDTFTLLPGLRYDTYRLDTTIDELYQRNSPDAEATDFSDSAFSPNLGFVWQTSPEIALVGRYARGFRSPLYSEINAGFTNLTSPFFRYKTLSNPNLKPETSDTFELGIRGDFPRGNFSVTGFYSYYENFIETFASAGVEFIDNGPPVNLFQSQNVGAARTYGVELAGEYRFSDQPHGFSVIGSLGLTVGDDLEDDEPLESVEPLKAVLGLRYRGQEDRWGTDLIATLVGEPRLRGDRPAGSYSPEGYAVVDLLGYYNINPNLKLNAGIFNLFNNQYFLYSDVRPLLNSPEPVDIDRFAQPGVSLRAGLTWQF